jgi:hypothetical protein
MYTNKGFVEANRPESTLSGINRGDLTVRPAVREWVLFALSGW